MDSIDFNIRLVTWSDYELQTPILLQDVNGPCPLIALVNTLLMKSEIKARNNQLNDISNDSLLEEVVFFKAFLFNKTNITLKELLSRLGDLMIKFNHGKDVDLDKLLESLPLLHTGLSVNPDLTNGDFEHDLALELFNIFDLDLCHGWIVDPKNSTESNDELVVKKFNELKYFDSIQDYLLSADDQPVRQWLDENSTQLTQYGIKHLDERLQVDDFIIFFRNNHFNTLYKKHDGDFYLLLTDSSFTKGSLIVWQSLISISGKDDLFFTGDFLPVLEDTTQDFSNMTMENEDYQLIKQLQEEDDKKYAENLQKSYEKRNPPVQQPLSKGSKSKSKDKTKESKDKTSKDPKDPKDPKTKKSDCIIV